MRQNFDNYDERYGYSSNFKNFQENLLSFFSKMSLYLIRHR